jgi:uncharacterized protein (TIGR00375 family)
MSIIADLHLHSKYSRAVSQKMDLKEIAFWAKKKGINLVSTADWTHPLWFRQIQENLVEKTPGIFKLKDGSFPEVAFILSTELSSIYSQNDKTHRIHNLVFTPSLSTAQKIIKTLQQQGVNLLADGRPIMGISSKDLLEILLSIDEKNFLIPCHIWTPWFSLYGSRSGFDSIEEAFGNYSKYITAVETGLSSDPIMNWQIEELDNRAIVSFSDAHSGPKLGREATVFIPYDKEKELNSSAINYDDIIAAFKQQKGKLKIGYTIEFFPEEGKYHWSGHRLCGIKYSPQEVLKKGELCPVCGKPLTIGVENRVLKLAKRIIKNEELVFLKNKYETTFVYDKEKKRTPFVSLVPLMEVLEEIHNSPTKAEKEYQRLTENFAPEFDILMRKTYEEIESFSSEKLKEAIKIIRERKVFVDPGYDGVFGIVKIFKNNEKPTEENQSEKQQLNLF